MNPTRLAVFATVVILSIGLVGTAAAAPGAGPPTDLPNPVPDFVSDLLGAISEFVSAVLTKVGDLMGELVPADAAPAVGMQAYGCPPIQ